MRNILCTIEKTIELPQQIDRLKDLVYNLWWVWQAEARELYRMWDYPHWRDSRHNPVKMLNGMTEQDKERLSRDIPFRKKLEKVIMRFDTQMNNGTSWFSQKYPELKSNVIAYFSAEFGFHNSLPIYSGGLGILSGDHCKEASDLGIPLVAIGFMYPQGYFHQRIPAHGWQEAVYGEMDRENTPISQVTDENGKRLKISVKLDSREIFVQIWCVHVGRVQVFLMDADIEENEPWERELTARLYGGDQEMRIQQEILLGIGGVRILRELGIHPTVWHMNEGHSAFLVLERIRELVQSGMSFENAQQVVIQTSVFTTHTPVAAGHDAFPLHMIEKYFWNYWGEMGLDRERFLELAQYDQDWGPAFNMTVLAMRNSAKTNSVSQIHTQVTREMWQDVWGNEHAPIVGITNGIHTPTWISGEMNHLLEGYLGPDWLDQHDEAAIWSRLYDIPAEALWNVKQDLKRKMFTFIWNRARQRWIEGEADSTQLLASGTLLDPEALTIGFARRFAPYKRATLIFRDIERLKRILLDVHRPVQLIFAGKAHPANDSGKHLIQQIINLAQDHNLGARVAFVQDYDMNLARYLVQGVDVWLNNPSRLLEASGTSGQKAALNGTPNLSVLDGWWPEGYNGANGWAIGKDNPYTHGDEQDAIDAESLYQLLEEEITPLYYQRDKDGVPRDWVQVMKESMITISPKFSLRRMLKEYVELMYVPAVLATFEKENA